MNNYKIIKNALSRVKYYFSDYILSVFIFQIIRIILILPGLSYIFSKILEEARLQSITNQNFLVLFKHPKSLLFMLLLLIISIIFIFYEFGYYFLLADKQVKGEDYNFKILVKGLSRKAKYFISIYSFLFMAYLLLLLPLVSVGLDSNLTDWIKIPNFIVDEVKLTFFGKILYLGAVAGLTYIALRLIYTIYFFVREKNVNILSSLKESWEFSKGKSLQNLILLVIVTVIFGVLFAALFGISMMPVILTDRYVKVLSPLTAGLSLTLVQILILFSSGIFQPLIANIIVESTGFFAIEKKEAKRKPINLLHYFNKNKIVKRVFLAVFIGVIFFNIYSVIRIVYQPETMVIAHRGDNKNAVENTITALRKAADAHADAVEIDIQETKDGEFVVMHDYSLKRLAGKNKKVRNMTLKELENTTIRQNGYEEKIPSLSDYIDMAKRRNILLLIEVKPHGHESPEMEENLVKLLKKKRVTKHFMVQSLDLDVLNKIKEIDKDIKTGYIIPLNLGELPETKHDFLVLEDFSLNKRIIKEAKDRDVELFAWTINDEETMKKYFKLDIDAIITNYPQRAVEIRDSKEDTKTFFNRVEYLLTN